jgi:hypothetical protein
MPESLVEALEHLGHQVDSVNHLKLKGLDNGTLYRQIAIDYDLCFTRDAGLSTTFGRREILHPSRFCARWFRNSVPNHSFQLLSKPLKNPIGRATRMATIGRVSRISSI